MDELYVNSVAMKENIVHDNDNYVFNIPAIKNLSEIEFKANVTFLVGENGTGKSTLLEAIAVKSGFNPEGGTKNFNFATNETHSQLYQYLTVSKGPIRPKDGFFLRAESFYNVATEIERLDKIGLFGEDIGHSFINANYGGKSLHNQSHGESFMSLVLNRFGENGLYILDEPEAALSPSRQLSLLVKINDLAKQNSQFIIATHSPIIMAYPNADIYVLGNDEIKKTAYQNTEHYTITKRFLDNPQRMMNYLFKE